MSTIETCIKILGLSNDGDSLSPRHLKLVEIAANGYASDVGLEALTKISGDLEQGNYQDWYFGIEGLTLDETGYVYYRGRCVEHYSFRDGNYSETAKAKAIMLVERLQASPHYSLADEILTDVDDSKNTDPVARRGQSG